MSESHSDQNNPIEGGYPSTQTETVANPNNVQAIHRWLNLQTSWGSGNPLESYAEYVPEGMSKEDLRAAFLDLRPLGIANEDYDICGYYITALADKILQEEFERKYPQGATEEEAQKFWNEEARIELDRPQTGEYDKFRKFGTYWKRGTLVLRGNFGKDEGIGYGMKGGKVLVIGDTGKGLGTFMEGGVLEIEGRALGGQGYGKKGGEIIVHNNPVVYKPPEIKKAPPKPIIEQAEDLIPAALARSGVEMEGALDIEGDIRQLMGLINEEVIPSGVPIKNPRGWFVGLREPRSPAYTSRDRAIIAFYNGSERSYRTPSVKMEICTFRDNSVSIVVRDWRKVGKVEKHQYNKYGVARKGKFYSTHIKNGNASNYQAGDIIDSSHEFPSEENLATQEGFRQAQMYELRDIVKEASKALKARRA